MNRHFLLGVIAVALSVSMWGVQLPVAKDAFAVLDLFHMTAIRYAIPATIMLAMLYAIEGRRSLSFGDHFSASCYLGVVGMFGSPLLVFIGMSMSRAEHVAVIVALQPSIAALALWYLRGLKPANFTIACIALAFVGVVLVVTKAQFEFAESKRALFGDFLAFLGAACWVYYAMGISRFSGWSTWRITAMTMVPGAIANLILTETLVILGYLARPSMTQIGEVVWELSYLVFVGVVVAMLLWNFGNRRIGPQNSTLLINLLPVSTFVYRAAQGYRFSTIEIIGASLVVAALIANNLYVRSHH